MSEAGKSREHGYFEKGVIMNDKKTLNSEEEILKTIKSIRLNKKIAKVVFIICLITCILLVSVVPEDTRILALCIFGFPVLFCLFGYLSMRSTEKSLLAKIEQDKIDRNIAERKEKAEKLFKMCRNNGLTAIYDENKSDFMLMSKQFNITDFEEAKRLFAEGEASVTGVEKQKEDAEKQKIDQQAIDYLADATQKSELQGKEKYLSYIRREHEKTDLLSKLAKSNANLSRTSASMASNERPRDWAIAGGLASAIGGPAAGIATAADMQAKNAHDAATRTDRVKSYREQAREYDRSSQELERRANGLHYTIERIETAVADEDEDRKYFSRINFTFKFTNVDLAGNISFNISATVSDADTVTIFNKPAFIDGSVFVYVLENGRRIGRTIVCAPKFDSANASVMGFEKLNEKVYCRPNPGEFFSKDKTYTFECEPLHIWAVQKW